MKKLLVLVMILMLVASFAMAQKIPSKKAPKGDGAPYITGKADYTEDFEGAFPPAGWTQGVTNPAYTWSQDFLSPYSGSACAYIAWQAGTPQDETLTFSWPVDVGDDLSFATQGNAYWATSANFTVEVNGTEDLVAYEGTTPTFTFRYAGDDGADQYLDAVHIGEYEEPPPPEDVSFCEMVSQETGTYFTGNTCGGENLVSALGCETYGEDGLESYYEIEVPNGCYFTATVTNTADGALWVLADCVAPAGAFTCLAYSDNSFTGEPEVRSCTW